MFKEWVRGVRSETDMYWGLGWKRSKKKCCRELMVQIDSHRINGYEKKGTRLYHQRIECIHIYYAIKGLYYLWVQAGILCRTEKGATSFKILIHLYCRIFAKSWLIRAHFSAFQNGRFFSFSKRKTFQL